MRNLTISIAALGLLAGSLRAQANEEFDKLQQEYEQAQQKWMEKIQKQAEENPTKMMNMFSSPAGDFLPRFRKLAEANAGTSQAIPALAWIIQNGMMAGAMPFTMGGGKQTDAQWAFDTLDKHHAADPAIKDALGDGLRYAIMDQEKLRAFCEKVRKDNPDKQANGRATLMLAQSLYDGPLFMLPGFSVNEEKQKADRQKAGSLFRLVAKDLAGTEEADEAGRYIYELENLQIGMKAPEIIGQDPEGKDIKLSQFKGQVVVLDFWGFW
jgi:hypothetical protein